MVTIADEDLKFYELALRQNPWVRDFQLNLESWLNDAYYDEGELIVSYGGITSPQSGIFRDKARDLEIDIRLLGEIYSVVADSNVLSGRQRLRSFVLNVFDGRNYWREGNFGDVAARVLSDTQIRSEILNARYDNFTRCLIGEMHVTVLRDNWDEEDPETYRIRRPLLVIPRRTDDGRKATGRTVRDFERKFAIPELFVGNSYFAGEAKYRQANKKDLPRGFAEEFLA